MKKIPLSFIMVLALALVSAFLLVPNVSASIIDLGIYDPQPGDGGDASAELLALNSVILANYNDTHDPNLPTATFGTENINVDPDANILSTTLDLTGWTYLKLKWDGQWQYYYIGGESGDHTFDSTVFNKNDQPQALSHYTFFGPTSVPEPGMLMLFGSGLLGLGIFGRKRFRK